MTVLVWRMPRNKRARATEKVVPAGRRTAKRTKHCAFSANTFASPNRWVLPRHARFDVPFIISGSGERGGCS